MGFRGVKSRVCGPLPDLSSPGFEALGRVLLLGLRTGSSGLDELLRAEFALHRGFLDVHLLLAVHAAQLLGLELIRSGLRLAPIGLGKQVVHGNLATAHFVRLRNLGADGSARQDAALKCFGSTSAPTYGAETVEHAVVGREAIKRRSRL